MNEDMPALVVSYGLQPRPTEKGMFVIHLHLENQDFADESEAQAFLQQFTGTRPQPAHDISPEEQAQVLAYDAFDSQDEVERNNWLKWPWRKMISALLPGLLCGTCRILALNKHWTWLSRHTPSPRSN